jgi:predicted nucleotide-binding protein (sugar kinase/HSP70/actin superfamily)
MVFFRYVCVNTLHESDNTKNNNNNNNNIIIPVIIETTEIVTKGLKKNLKAIPGKNSIDSLQQTAVLGTSHIIRKELQPET